MATPRTAPQLLTAAPRCLAAIAGVGVVALGAAGCSLKGGDNVNLVEGKQVFVAKCGACHTLARAGTKGTVGPNLDAAFRHSLEEGVAKRNIIRGVVEAQIENPNPHGAMPKALVSGGTQKDVAAYVAASVARPGQDTGLLATAVEKPGAGKPAVEKNGTLEIAAEPTGQLSYTTKVASATPGAVKIVMANTSGISHNIALEAGAHEATGPGPPIGASSFVTKGTTSVSVTLKAGKYTYFCEAPGHRAAGMYGTLTVK